MPIVEQVHCDRCGRVYETHYEMMDRYEAEQEGDEFVSITEGLCYNCELSAERWEKSE